MHDRLRHLTAVTLIAVVAALALGVGTAGAQDDCGKNCTGQRGGASAGPTGVSARIGAGGGVTTSPSGGSSNCVYANLTLGGLVPGSSGNPDVGPYQLDDGTVFVWASWACVDGEIADCEYLSGNGTGQVTASFDEAFRSFFDCDGDGVADGESGDLLVEIGNTTELAAFALDEMPWPELVIRTGMANPISGFPIPLVLDDGAGTTFDTEFEAIADDNGLSVTATGIAREVQWLTGSINSYWQSRVGGDWPTDETLCTDFGRDLTESPPAIWKAIPTEEKYGCVTAFRASSATEPGDKVTLESAVVYDIEYEVNIAGFVALGLPEWQLDFISEPIQVREIQSIVVSNN